MSECVVYGNVLPDVGWTISEVLSLVSIVVDFFVGAVIAYFISGKLSSDREFRNYFIKEVCEEKCKHESFWTNFEKSEMSLPEVLAWFKQRNMATTALMNSFKKKKKKTSSNFEEYVRKMRGFIDDTDWMQKPQRNGHHKLSQQDKDRITAFRRNHASIFHDVVSEING